MQGLAALSSKGEELAGEYTEAVGAASKPPIAAFDPW